MTSLTRRTLLGATAGLAAATAVEPTLSATAAASVPFGVCIHSLFRQSVYADSQRVLATVLDSGARYVRDKLGEGAYDQAPLFRAYRDAGLKLHLTMGAYGSPVNRELLRTRLLAVADCVDSVAGWNEPDGSNARSVWLPPTVDHQRWLYQMVRSEPTLDHVTVLPGALRDRNTQLAADLAAMYAAIDGLYDMPNLHLYPGPKRDVRAYLAQRLSLVPGGRAWITEGGGNTERMTEARQAHIVTELAKAQAERGTRTYVYELLDDTAAGHTGVYRFDFTRKPAATALAAL